MKKMKKGAVKKQVVKKQKTVQKVRPQRMAMAMIPFSKIAKPEMYRGKMTLAPSPFTEKQIQAIVAATPQEVIKSRPGKGGGQWDYVPGWWFKKKANFVFGFSHDFEIIGERVDGDFITVKGKVTVRDPKTGNVIASKTDYGGAEIKYRKGTKQPLDIGNDFKAAATDSFKRCMVQFGFAMDVYGKSESIQEGVIVQNDMKEAQYPSQGQKEAPAKAQGVKTGVVASNECQDCLNTMTSAEVSYSKKMYKGKQLCRSCQKLYKDNNWN